MTLEKRQQKSRNQSSVLTGCPAEGCDREFEEPAGVGRREHMLREHDPEDFNL